MSGKELVPDVLRSTYPTSSLIRNEIWKRLHRKNEHYQAGVFGREGKGKSGTALSIAEMVDPDMNVDQVMFDPGRMMEKISEWKEAGTTKGRMIVADEAGVGLGNRTWYEEDQIEFAQVLQLIRSENMGILFTVPRGKEMDSQVRSGRLHAQILVRKKRESDFVEIEYEKIEVGRRVDNDDLWSPKPDMQIEDVGQRITSLKIGPPSQELWEEYEKAKNAFQSEQYKNAAGDGDGQEDGETELKQMAKDLGNGNIEKVVGQNGRTKEAMVDVGLIRAECDVSRPDAKAIKSLLEKEYTTEELEEYV